MPAAVRSAAYPAAVSYTHLDVYKRQPQLSLPFSISRPLALTASSASSGDSYAADEVSPGCRFIVKDLEAVSYTHLDVYKRQPQMRLDKLLSHLNCGSRKEVQALIRAGRVSVDGTVHKLSLIHI